MKNAPDAGLAALAGAPFSRILIELMPALHLLVIAAELALKAHLVRSNKDKPGHSLRQLYADLEPAHRTTIELRFAQSYLNTNLAALGIERPTVEAILGFYDETYGGESRVYMDSRYYAEPTKMFKTKKVDCTERTCSNRKLPIRYSSQRLYAHSLTPIPSSPDTNGSDAWEEM